MPTHLELPDKWAPSLLKQGETGMGYQTASITLRDGRVIEDVLIIGGTVAEVRGCVTIPFSVEDISEIKGHPSEMEVSPMNILSLGVFCTHAIPLTNR